MRFPSRAALAAVAAILAAAPLTLAAQEAQGAPALRDPAVPYGSFSDATREIADAIGGRPLARPADGRYLVGDAIVIDDDGKPYRAHVIAVQPTRYDVHYDGFSRSWTRYFTSERILGYQPGYVPAARAAAPAPAAPAATGDAIGPGRYGCTESQFRMNRGFEYEMRGSITLAADGGYEYPGMRSRGRWRWDAATAAARFTGGFLDGARATRLDGGPRLRVELPTGNPDRPRTWTCGRVDAR